MPGIEAAGKQRVAPSGAGRSMVEYGLKGVHYVVIGLFAFEQNVFANSVLTPLPQSPQLSCSLGPFDLVTEGVSNILVHIFLLTCRFGCQLLRTVFPCP